MHKQEMTRFLKIWRKESNMDVLTKEEFMLRKREFLQLIRDGALFIHPTDTIYGIGCDATNSEAVKAVREIKDRWHNPLSIIAPSKDWLRENCELTAQGKVWLEKLPGPYTLILRLKKDDAVAEDVNLASGTLGVRLPEHWFTEIASEAGVPIVTTSANVHGQHFMTSLEDLNKKIEAKMSFAVYEGVKTGRPSKLIHLTEKEERLIER